MKPKVPNRPTVNVVSSDVPHGPLLECAGELDHAVGPNVIRNLTAGMEAFLESHAADGWTRLEDFIGARRDRIVAHAEIKRPEIRSAAV